MPAKQRTPCMKITIIIVIIIVIVIVVVIVAIAALVRLARTSGGLSESLSLALSCSVVCLAGSRKALRCLS